MKKAAYSALSLHLPDPAPFARGGDLAALTRRADALLPACLAGEDCFADSLGWLHIDKWADGEMLARLKDLAETIRKRDKVFVLIGVGGSNNAARAVIESIGDAGGTRVVYAGNNLSPHAMRRVLAELEGKSFSICVIAKNFETIEPGLAFRFLRQELVRRYGDRAAARVVAIGTTGSLLHEICSAQGYTFLPFPDDIGGRYTSLSAVGLLPMAVAGVDIDLLIAGAKSMRARLEDTGGADNPAVQYAALRNLLYEAGYRVELLAFFEPRLKWFAKWWVQLFGESEGKEGKGVFPAAAEYSEDLHSIGQFVQEGSPLLFETLLDAGDDETSCPVVSDGMDDGFAYLDGRELGVMNRAALEATAAAHAAVLPLVRLALPALDAERFGALFYFFQFACYLSGRLLGVNPFDQPGVEAYKNHMFHKLDKPQ